MSSLDEVVDASDEVAGVNGAVVDLVVAVDNVLVVSGLVVVVTESDVVEVVVLVVVVEGDC